jgi:hypothetical protein
MATYTLIASNCEFPNIELKISDHFFAITAYRQTAELAFRQIKVFNDETGEVMYDRYVSDEWWKPMLSIAEALDELKAQRLEFLKR